jgi:hypothetical protein
MYNLTLVFYYLFWNNLCATHLYAGEVMLSLFQMAKIVVLRLVTWTYWVINVVDSTLLESNVP